LQFYEKSFEAFDNSTYPISKEMIGYLIKNQLTMGKLLIKDKQFENVIKFYKTAIARINKSKAIADDNKNYIDELKNLITKAKECKKKHDLLKKHTKV